MYYASHVQCAKRSPRARLLIDPHQISGALLLVTVVAVTVEEHHQPERRR